MTKTSQLRARHTLDVKRTLRKIERSTDALDLDVDTLDT